MIEEVKPGVFFAAPEPLPRGRHRLERSHVAEVQRERLMAAFTELLADRGYANVSTVQIARQARVSLAAFYEHFADKDECAEAAYGRFIDVLLGRMLVEEVTEGTAAEIVRGRIRTYFGTLQSDPVVARAFQVEMDAAGPAARALRRRSLQVMATALDARHDLILRAEPGLRPLPPTAHWAIVHAARARVREVLDMGSVDDLTEHIEPSIEFALGVYRGAGVGPCTDPAGAAGDARTADPAGRRTA